MVAVIFDLDGTLIDLFGLHLRMFQEVMAEKAGLTFKADDLRAYYGKTGEEIITSFMQKNARGTEDVHRLAVERRSRVIKALRGGNVCRILPGVKRLLDELKAAGIIMAVGSSNTPDLGEAIMRSCGLGGYFTVESYKSPDIRGKPASDIFLRAAEMLNLLVGDCIVVEDSLYGIEAARAAQMKVIAVATGENGIGELASLNPDLLLNTLEELDLRRINVLFEAAK